MTWEEKFAAMKALVGDFSIRLAMRAPGDWYVDCRGREIGGDGLLASLSGDGRTPQEAVEDDWRKNVEELPADRYLVLRAMHSDRRHVRWNGFMWIEVSVPAARRVGQ